MGCTNCIKRCPTEAIRVQGGKAVIASERCIDCGECIRICPHHAKRARFTALSEISGFTYKIALPAPSLYGQFNNLDDIDYVLTGIKQLGFDDVFEVSRAAELVSEATRKLLASGRLKRPVISSACPAVVRLIRVRFPDLCDHVLPLKSPMETAAALAKAEAVKKTGLPEEQMGLGHAFEIDPDVENGFLYELAQAEMAREIFPKAPLKYMPPTKFMTGNIFRGHVQDALFNMVTALTGQKIHLLGMMTEAIHTPFLSDRFLAIQNAQYIFRTMHDLGSEITFKEGGIMQTRANDVLKKATDLLGQIEQLGIFETLERGIFADIKRPRDGGKGLDGVVTKAPGYFNPFLAPMMKGGAGK